MTQPLLPARGLRFFYHHHLAEVVRADDLSVVGPLVHYRYLNAPTRRGGQATAMSRFDFDTQVARGHIVAEPCAHPPAALVYLGEQQIDADDLTRTQSLFNCSHCKSTITKVGAVPAQQHAPQTAPVAS